MTREDHSFSRYWDEAAAAFDDEPDHGLRDPAVRRAWRAYLQKWLPAERASVLDVGCGTGSLTHLLAELGHQVMGADRSPAMIARARDKAPPATGHTRFLIMDATTPAFAPRSFDVVLCRHLLWALADPAQVLRQLADLLATGGRLVLIEGYWHTGGGLHADALVGIIPPAAFDIQIDDLSPESHLWGGVVTDERYAVIARRRT